jgi:hypothetical protein
MPHEGSFLAMRLLTVDGGHFANQNLLKLVK